MKLKLLLLVLLITTIDFIETRKLLYTALLTFDTSVCTRGHERALEASCAAGWQTSCLSGEARGAPTLICINSSHHCGERLV